ncbi:MAG: hypothetical protein ABIO02_00305 [Patescibacteria group bacterium]
MEVQSLFYGLGSVFMILGIVAMIALLVMIWKAFETFQKAQRSITELKENVEAKVSAFADARSTEIASTLGKSVASYFFGKVKKVFNKD